MRYYPRDLEPVLRHAVSAFRVVALTGARQTGKSTLLLRLFARTHRYVALDNPRALQLAQQDPEAFFEEYQPPVIVDEIQYAPALLPFIKHQVDRVPTPGRFVLTGSQQFTMMRSLQETLAGRVGLFHLLPMALTEGRVSTRTYQYRGLAGSYPELVVSNRHRPDQWHAAYLATYLERDVQPHYRLEKIAHFRDLVFLLAARSAQLLNYAALASDLGVSLEAIKSWVRILEASQILYLLRPYYVNLGSRLIKSPKVYFTDTGFLNYLLGNRERRALTEGPRAGPVFENFVVQEVLKAYANRGRQAPLFYYRTNNGLEVDLLVEERAGTLRPCEVKLTRTPRAHHLQAVERLRRLNRGRKVTIGRGALVTTGTGTQRLTRQDTAYGLREFLATLR